MISKTIKQIIRGLTRAGVSPFLQNTTRVITAALVCSVAQILCIKNASAENTTAPRPNIILIVADDMGYGDAGFNGQTRIRTPHLDRMAREGIIFTHHYAGSPVCTPSRVCLKLGLHSGHTGIASNGFSLPPNPPVISEMLQDAGYSTHFIGKWGVGGAEMEADPWLDTLEHWHQGTGALIAEEEDIFPLKKGFDTSLAFMNQAYAHFYMPKYIWRNDERVPVDGNQSSDYEERTTYIHDWFEDETLRIVRDAEGEKPFFILASYTLPHRETKAPPGYNPYADTGWPEVEQAYAAMVSYLDETVGNILDAVQANPKICDNTLIIFTSDNGPQYTDGHDPWFFNSSGPFRGTKRDLYEGGIRVPTVMHWKGMIPPGSTSDHISAFWDYFATFADLAGGRIPERTDSISFAPILTGVGEQQTHDYLFWRFEENAGGPAREGGFEPPQRIAIHRGEWKAVQLRDGTTQLFNLDKDIGETENMATQHPDILRELLHIAQEADQPVDFGEKTGL